MAKKKTKKKIYSANLFPGEEHPLNEEFAQVIIELENKLNMPVWLLVQQVTKLHNPEHVVH